MSKTIKILDITKSNAAVDISDGITLYNEIVSLLARQEEIILDFSGIEILTSSFLNNSIGLVYNTQYKNEMDSKVKYINLSARDLDTVSLVKKRAIEFFARQNPQD
jgi:hypothetical protein